MTPRLAGYKGFLMGLTTQALIFLHYQMEIFTYRTLIQNHYLFG
jgi:hypothetical protein